MADQIPSSPSQAESKPYGDAISECYANTGHTDGNTYFYSFSYLKRDTLSLDYTDANGHVHPYPDSYRNPGK